MFESRVKEAIWILGAAGLLGLMPTRASAARQIPPVPEPKPGHIAVLQFVNESKVTLLLAAFGPTAIEPRERTWVLKPGGFLTLDIPKAWQNTVAEGSAGPRFWARTGCRHDPGFNIAQCETGDWAGDYDAFKGRLRPFPTGKSPNTFTEWCFNCPEPGKRVEGSPVFWDVSGVDGADLSVNVEPMGEFTPDSADPFSCKTPNAVSGADLRSVTSCPPDFQLKRSDLSTTIIENDGSVRDGDHVVACFSNCGLRKFPLEPPFGCQKKNPTDRCLAWIQYCCTAEAPGEVGEYHKDCSTDADCSFGDGCLAFDEPGTHKHVMRCQCRGWIVHPPCPDSVCTNQGAAGGNPPLGTCTSDRLATDPFACIGDDTFHEVMPRAFSWPNDAQTYNCKAESFRVTFAPGGTSAPITDESKVPLCEDLPSKYDFQKQKMLCSGVTGKVFAGARPPSTPPGNWDCDVKPDGPTLGVLCRWGE